MNERKIDAMHILYGTGEGFCDECKFFREGYYHDKKLFKCSIYGLTHSVATDWRKKYVACGLKNKLSCDDDRPVIERLKCQRQRQAEPIDGQISMEDIQL